MGGDDELKLVGRVDLVASECEDQLTGPARVRVSKRK